MSAPPSMPSLMVNMWVVEDGHQEELVDGLYSLYGNLRSLERFISGQILRGSNPTRYVSMATMRSVEDCDRAVENPRTRALLRGLRGIARFDHDTYRALGRFEPDTSGATIRSAPAISQSRERR